MKKIRLIYSTDIVIGFGTDWTKPDNIWGKINEALLKINEIIDWINKQEEVMK